MTRPPSAVRLALTQQLDSISKLSPVKSPSRKRGAFSSGIYVFEKPLQFGGFSIQTLGFGDGRDGHSHAGDSNGELRALPCRRVGRKPPHPLFIHSGKVCFLKKNDSGTHNSFERSACGFEDGRYIFEALSGLLLDGIPNNRPGYRVLRPSA